MMQRFTLLAVAVCAALLGAGVAFASLHLIDSAWASDRQPVHNGVINQIPAAQSALPKVGRTFLRRTGITHTLSTVTASQVAFPNDGRTWIEVENEYTASQVITIETPGTVGGLPIEDLEVTIPATTIVKIGPFIGSLFNRKTNPDKGYIYVTLEDTATMPIGAFSVGGQ